MPRAHSTNSLFWLVLGIPAIHFLVPREWIVRTHLDHTSVQAAMCAGVTVYLVTRALYRNRPKHFIDLLTCILRGLVAGLSYTGLLELAQLMCPDRRARFSDFEWNAAGVITTVILYVIVSCGAFIIWRVYETERRRALQPYTEHN